MKKLVFMLLIIFTGINAISQNESVLYKNDSLKYLHHDTYELFLQFLKDSIAMFSSDVEKLIYIRKKVASVIDLGAGSRDVSLLSNNWVHLSAQQYYDLFHFNTATVKCGGTSIFLKNVYENLGYESYTYDMGCPSLYTHQVTIVKSNEDDVYYVQDAFYNISYYEHKSKKYLHFDKMIYLLNKRKSRKIKVKYDAYDYEFTWDTTGLSQVLLNREIKTKVKRALKRVTLNRKKFINASQKFNQRAKKCLVQNELPEKSIYLYLLPQEHNSEKIKGLIVEAKKETFEE